VTAESTVSDDHCRSVQTNRSPSKVARSQNTIVAPRQLIRVTQHYNASKYKLSAAAEFLNLQGTQFVANGQVELAIECYTSALSGNPTNPLLLCNRSCAHSALTPPDWTKSLADANAAVGEDEWYWKAWSRKGLAELKIGCPEKAVSSFKRAKELFKDLNPTEDLSPSLRDGLEDAKRKWQVIKTKRFEARFGSSCSSWYSSGYDGGKKQWELLRYN
jgi:tetratricopeptide (TPR) repeat protein